MKFLKFRTDNTTQMVKKDVCHQAKFSVKEKATTDQSQDRWDYNGFFFESL